MATPEARSQSGPFEYRHSGGGVIYVCHLNLQKAFQKRNENPIEDTQVDYMRINAVNRFRAEVESIIYMTTMLMTLFI